jgi:hypothetical protein
VAKTKVEEESDDDTDSKDSEWVYTVYEGRDKNGHRIEWRIHYPWFCNYKLARELNTIVVI